MLDKYLVYMEICMQLYTNNIETEEAFDCMSKYDKMCEQAYNKLSEEDKEILREIINTKITNVQLERSTIMHAQLMMKKDSELNDIYPGHIKAQYSDKLRRYQREIHYLSSVAIRIKPPRGISK